MNRTNHLHQAVFDQFPEYRAEIIDGIATDPDVRSLCQDYENCAAALERFRQSSQTAPERVREYERLLADLEAEIRDTFAQG